MSDFIFVSNQDVRTEVVSFTPLELTALMDVYGALAGKALYQDYAITTGVAECASIKFFSCSKCVTAKDISFEKSYSTEKNDYIFIVREGSLPMFLADDFEEAKTEFWNIAHKFDPTVTKHALLKPVC